MPLPGPAGSSPGGIVRCMYANAGLDLTHMLTLHVAWFDQTPSGPDNDRLYVSGGPVVPTESGILATFSALAALWAPYYSADWALSLESLWLNSAGTYTLLTPAPTAAPVAGSGTDDASLPRLDRFFKLVGRNGARRDLYLQEVGGTVEGVTLQVTPTTGGIDARDQAWIAYLSGASGGGAVMRDGTYAFPTTEVRVWWARRPFEDARGVLTGVPRGHSGDVLYHDGSQWRTLPVGARKHELTVTAVGTKLLPRFQPCCGADAVPAVPPTETGGTQLTGGGAAAQAPARCGAALKMAQWLETYYANVREVLGALLTKAIAIGLNVLVDGVTAALTDGMGIPLVMAAEPAIVAVARLLIASLHIDFFPALTVLQDSTILQTVYAALPAGVSSFAITSDIIQQWELSLAGSSAVFTDSQLPLLLRLIEVPALAVWQKIAYEGALAPSDLCAAFVVRSGGALRGGAELSSAAGAALQGGALFLRPGAALSGGGSHLDRIVGALQGGALS